MTRVIVPMSESEQMRVLMLAYRFPPMGGSGVQRSVKFVKYLRSFGWEPHVITVLKGFGLSQDDGLLKELPPGIAVDYVGRLQFAGFRRFLRNRLRRRQENLLRSNRVSSRAKSRQFGMLDRLKGGVSRVLIPDGEIFWAASAFWAGISLVRRRHISVIYSSAPPYSSHLAAVALGRKTGRPVVLDFRDPWTDRAFYPWGPLRKSIERRLERYVLKEAAAVICNHQPMREDFLKMVPEEPPSKFIVITNGFDEGDFSQHLQVRRPEGLSPTVFSHIGQVYPRTTIPLVKALEALLRENPGLAKQVRVRLVGGLPLPSEDSAYLAGSCAKGVVDVIPRVDHVTAIREMFASDVLLLLLTAEDPGLKWYPGKLFEYLRVCSPILALVPSGSIAADLVREFEAGSIVDPENVEAIKQGIQRFLTGGGAVAPRAHPQGLRQFRRDVLTGQLAEVFSGVIGQRTRFQGTVPLPPKNGLVQT